jgi:hypothetical protein
MNPRMAIDCIACARVPTAAWSMPVAAQNNQLHGRPKRAYSLRWQKIIPSPYSKPRELKKLFESQWFEWPDGTIEQPAGAFASDSEARDWIVALGRLVLFKRERMIALEAYNKGLLRSQGTRHLRGWRLIEIRLQNDLKWQQITPLAR